MNRKTASGWAVQWHPEMALAEESSGKLFGAFVGACRSGA
jgi:gamma-glutamyl-gamma-aminobutyrate hydrolase PuuD